MAPIARSLVGPEQSGGAVRGHGASGSGRQPRGNGASRCACERPVRGRRRRCRVRAGRHALGRHDRAPCLLDGCAARERVREHDGVVGCRHHAPRVTCPRPRRWEGSDCERCTHTSLHKQRCRRRWGRPRRTDARPGRGPPPVPRRGDGVGRPRPYVGPRQGGAPAHRGGAMLAASPRSRFAAVQSQHEVPRVVRAASDAKPRARRPPLPPPPPPPRSRSPGRL